MTEAKPLLHLLIEGRYYVVQPDGEYIRLLDSEGGSIRVRTARPSDRSCLCPRSQCEHIAMLRRVGVLPMSVGNSPNCS